MDPVVPTNNPQPHRPIRILFIILTLLVFVFVLLFLASTTISKTTQIPAAKNASASADFKNPFTQDSTASESSYQNPFESTNSGEEYTNPFENLQ